MARLDLLVVMLYMGVIVAAGFWAQRRATTQDQFLVAGRSVGPWLYSGTLAAIVLGGASTVGGVKLGYQYGVSGMWVVFMFGLGILMLSIVFVGRILDLKLYTVPELLERRYSRIARIAGGVVMVAYDLMVSVTATIAVGSLMQVIVGIPSTPAILLSSAVMVLYSVLGGMWSLTLTDIIQFVIKTVGIFFILLPGAIWHAGGLAAMHARLPPEFFSLTNIGTGQDPVVLHPVLLRHHHRPGCLAACVHRAQRARGAHMGGIGVGCYCLCYALAGALIGAAGTTLPAAAWRCRCRVRRDRQRGAAGRTARPGAGGGTGGHHVDRQRLPARSVDGTARGRLSAAARVARRAAPSARAALVTLLLGAVMIVLSCLMHDVIAALTVAYDLLVGGLLVAVIGAILWQRGTTAGALASTAVGSILVCVLLAVKGIDSDWPIYIGLGGSLAVYVIVSLWTTAQ